MTKAISLHNSVWANHQASATGRCDKTVREFLEQNFNNDVVATERGTVKLAIKALLEVVQSGQRNLEVNERSKYVQQI